MQLDRQYDSTPRMWQMLNKVPEVTVYFWVIKVLSTTVGETAADFLNVSVHLGLTGTTLVMAVALVAVLGWQFRADRYEAWSYWLAVVLVSIVGTLITDNLSDNLGVPLEASTAVFAVLLAATFAIWYRSEGTLSIHSIVTTRREAFYWTAILFTFALGTAAGDLLSERLDLGYLLSGLIFAAMIAVVASAYAWSWLNPVVAFWIAYVLTRPLGASLGDYLTQSRDDGGLGLGPVITSGLFLATILVLVGYLSVTKRDAPPPVDTPYRTAATQR
ncbi:hypothetical protein Q2K19_26700 [Micromonospora soli]|uniref:COG4705 family protein n=1 Tax=Micromonospora sp. NBRC 110009 TaxID=3061627 RepID=UPI002672B53C|nr:hypothetical protein [Micromonospora sp. NBRC 110009]WKT97732.1 hypothetical protein Q2K19_26700 [Micromonospora sp. NBRC 110009]